MPALAHRLSLRPELWVQRLRPEDLVRELLDRVPTPAAEADARARPPSDPRGDAEARRVRRRSPASGCSPRSCSAARSWPRSPRRSRSCSSSGSSLARAAAARRALRPRRRAPGRGRAGRGADLELRAGTLHPATRAALRPAARARDRRAEPAGAAAARRRAARARATRCAASAGARTSSATSCSARSDRFGLLVFEQPLELPRPLKVYPRGEELRALLRPLETQAFAGNQIPRVRGEGIEFADLRPFVPGDRIRRINWRATARRGEPWVNETHPGAEHRRRHLPRHLRRGARRRERHARPRRRGGGVARRALHRGEGSRRPRRLRRRAQLADRLERDRPALPRARLAARRGDLPQLRLEGHRRAAGANAAAPSARAGADAAAGRPLGARADRPAGPRLRPGRDRDLAGAVRASRERASSTTWPTGSGSCGGRRCGPRTCATACPSSSGSEGMPLQAALEEVRTFRRHARVVRV